MNKIGFRILIFNILLVFLPIAFIFYLDTFENGELEAQERSMVQQGRLMASALSNKDLKSESNRILDSLNRRLESRIRVIALNGDIVGDSSRPDKNDDKSQKISYSRVSKIPQEDKSIDSRGLYKMVRWSLDLYRYLIYGPSRSYSEETATPLLEWVEVKKALEGRYGSATRISKGGQRSVTLYSAIPIYKGEDVSGVVLVSQSTYRILQNLYQIRVDILKIFIITLLIALGISYIMTRTISYPIKQLRDQALGAIDRKGKVTNRFKETKRRDEIGDLNRSLYELTSKLKDHLEKSQDFASDLSHELRNPLASIKTATEIIESHPEDSKEFINQINRELYRLDKLIVGVRELSKIDNGSLMEDLVSIDPVEITNMVVASQKLRSSKRVNYNILGSAKDLLISPTLFSQVIENIISNAYSFSNDGDTISITFIDQEDSLTISIRDNGPGIPKENLDKVFNRFFSYRMENSTINSGIGLSIAKSIMELYKGDIFIKNLPQGGLEVSLVFRNLNTLVLHH